MNNVNNPFEITFGKEPESLISRDNETGVIFNTFTNEFPDSQVYIISGIRGSGKTVCLTTLSNSFKSLDNWLVVEINPETDILEQLASKIYDEGKLRKLFTKVEFNFSFKGLGFSISGGKPITNVSSLLKVEFEYLQKKNINVLITIDEVSSNQYVKVFAHEYQLFIRNNYRVFLLMTGLYQNVNSLQNEKTLTFLNRAPKINLPFLNLKAVVSSYKRIFNIEEKAAIKLAKLTNGYPFAYQLLGDILYKKGNIIINDEVIDAYDIALQERAYSLIYKELTSREKDIVKSICKDGSFQAIIKDIGISKSQLSNYRKILINKGILCDNTDDVSVFKLPRFKEYIEFLLTIE